MGGDLFVTSQSDTERSCEVPDLDIWPQGTCGSPFNILSLSALLSLGGVDEARTTASRSASERVDHLQR